MDNFSFGILFGMISLVLFNVLLLQQRGKDPEKHRPKKGRNRTNAKVDQGKDDIYHGE